MNKLQDRPTILVGLNIVVLVLAATATYLLASGSSLQEKILPILTPLSLIILGLIINSIFFNLILERQTKIDELNVRLRRNEYVSPDSIDVQPPVYVIDTWEEEFQIDSRGDTRYTRRCRIKYFSHPVFWYLVGLTLIDGKRIESINELEIKAKNSKTNTELKWTPLIITGERIRLAILLEPIVDDINQTSDLEISLKWKGLFSPLIMGMQDKGSITLSNPANYVGLKFILPSHLRFTNMETSPKVGRFEISDASQTGSILEYYVNELSPGRLDYWIYCAPR